MLESKLGLFLCKNVSETASKIFATHSITHCSIETQNHKQNKLLDALSKSWSTIYTLYTQYTYNYAHSICTVYTQLCTHWCMYAQYIHNYTRISLCTVYTQLYTHQYMHSIHTTAHSICAVYTQLYKH